MDISHARAFCFSPTGATRSVLEIISAALPYEVYAVDITDHAKKDRIYRFQADDLLVVGVPVYAGRIPQPAVERLRHVSGEGSPAFIVVTYGNRAYEDALKELHDIVTEQGFSVVGAAAVVARHSIFTRIAADRPDESDDQQISEFALRFADRIDRFDGVLSTELDLPGQYPYRARSSASLVPAATHLCDACGICVDACPVGAISADDPYQTDRHACICCMRCTQVCPRGARRPATLPFKTREKIVASACRERKSAEFFLV
jgi:ferredoxin